MTEARPVETETEQKHAVVPIDGLLRTEQPKPRFWRRLSLRGAKERSAASLGEPTDDDRILARLDAIAAQLAASEHSLNQRVEQLDEKFSEVWEVEETLSRLIELHELLSEMREHQGQVAGRLRGLERRLTFVALVAATAALAGIVATVVALTP